jgi:hypothetical protein
VHLFSFSTCSFCLPSSIRYFQNIYSLLIIPSRFTSSNCCLSFLFHKRTSFTVSCNPSFILYAFQPLHCGGYFIFAHWREHFLVLFSIILIIPWFDIHDSSLYLLQLYLFLCSFLNRSSWSKIILVSFHFIIDCFSIFTLLRQALYTFGYPSCFKQRTCMMFLIFFFISWFIHFPQVMTLYVFLSFFYKSSFWEISIFSVFIYNIRVLSLHIYPEINDSGTLLSPWRFSFLRAPCSFLFFIRSQMV